ncbi:MAG: protein-L-isoaspartate O-methyltransferase, partial [Alphaproteobacteria bacterium]|nr:protein-L-isoaspartate O-methyltransferase [Alphaproteobacteria bacterium]
LGQLMTNEVLDLRLLNAMTSVPRAQFVPEAYAGAAYVDDELPMGRGRWLPDPLCFARLLQAVDIQPYERVLDVGCAYGYSTAVIAKLALEVIGCESDRAMAEMARRKLDAIGAANARIAQVTILTDGYGADGPYDAIVVEGAMESPPASLLRLLSEGGRLAMVTLHSAPHLGSSSGRGALTLYTLQNGKIYVKKSIEMGAPLLANPSGDEAFLF